MATQYLSLLAPAAAVVALWLLFLIYNVVVAQPRKLLSALRRQGLSGPPQALLLGNILEMKRARDAAAPVPGPPVTYNCGAMLLPFFDEWREHYGEVFVFALGTTQVVHVTQPEMVKEITTCTSLDLRKPMYHAKERGALLGQGILTSNGPHWVHQRKILAPELFMDKIKGMIKLILDSSMSLCKSWTRLIEENGGSAEIKIDEFMRSFTGDITMAINETLRLYPPVPVVSREALKDMKFGKLNVPKGVNLWTLVTTLHTDPEIWVSDSYEFNPKRFADGVAGACKYPYLYMPFGVGPRVCLGQNLALIELKILISLILSKYSISLSPKYVHSPHLQMVIEPKFGVHLLVKPL